MFKPGLFICLVFIGLSEQSSDKSLYIGRDCENYEIHHVNDDQTYTIIWDGDPIPSYCTIGFIGRDSGYMNEYKVCVTKDTWSLPNCGAKVSLEKGVVSVLSQMYSCYYEPSRWCGDSDDYVDVKFDSTSTYEHDEGEIRLKITAVMTYNYNLTIGIAVGGSIIGLIFIVLVIVLVSRAKARQRTPVILTSGYSGPATVSQGLSNPVMYSVPTASYQQDNNWNKPPPSYESVVNTASPAYPPPSAPSSMN